MNLIDDPGPKVVHRLRNPKITISHRPYTHPLPSPSPHAELNLCQIEFEDLPPPPPPVCLFLLSTSSKLAPLPPTPSLPWLCNMWTSPECTKDFSKFLNLQKNIQTSWLLSMIVYPVCYETFKWIFLLHQTFPLFPVCRMKNCYLQPNYFVLSK